MLEIDNLHQYYGSSHILRGVNWSVPQGSLSTLMGRNGVGKTTLMQCLMGVQPAAQGRIVLDGQDITRLSPAERVRAGMAYVPQGREIFPRLSVHENLLMGAASRRAPKGIPDYIHSLFPVLRDMAQRMGGDLSGGQQQQLAIARALMSQPRLLILDEPTEGIQPNVIDQIGDALQWLQREQGLTIVLVEQYLDFVRRIADRYAVMRRGAIVAQGDREALAAADLTALVSV
ncbi:urea ABC transporter ATP-binding subunit UrtE [Amphibiibacter pelophylacis]|uniref:Urea ABC transporter ATP-binding subunit UrtE n=1 Tax=Amphibiibacter pelophylacis TaxID=1799477 RepID=A0ACC6P1H5_9BURK